MIEENTRELAGHLSRLLTSAQHLIGRIQAGHPNNRVEIRAILNNRAFISLINDVAAANAWLAREAVRTEVIAAAHLPADVSIEKLFPTNLKGGSAW
jgi:hypothetical protein